MRNFLPQIVTETGAKISKTLIKDNNPLMAKFPNGSQMLENQGFSPRYGTSYDVACRATTKQSKTSVSANMPTPRPRAEEVANPKKNTFHCLSWWIISQIGQITNFL